MSHKHEFRRLTKTSVLHRKRSFRDKKTWFSCSEGEEVTSERTTWLRTFRIKWDAWRGFQRRRQAEQIIFKIRVTLWIVYISGKSSASVKVSVNSQNFSLTFDVRWQILSSLNSGCINPLFICFHLIFKIWSVIIGCYDTASCKNHSY